MIHIPENMDGLFFSIPFEEDWNILVDGKRAQANMVLDALMFIPLESGEHNISLQYIPKGWRAGCYISILSLIIALVWKAYPKVTSFQKNKGKH